MGDCFGWERRGVFGCLRGMERHGDSEASEITLLSFLALRAKAIDKDQSHNGV